MNTMKLRRLIPHLLLVAALIMVVGGVLVMTQTFTHYNELSLQRQDDQLEEMARTVDESISMLIGDLREDLDYVLNRRGLEQAEKTWLESSDTEDILFRMNENLVMQSPLIHGMLAFREGTIRLSTTESTEYYFPAGLEGDICPCYAGDGTMYLAVVQARDAVLYAALVDIARLYQELDRVNVGEGMHLLLLGRQEKVLLHKWPNQAQVSNVQELTAENCDLTAVRFMMESSNAKASRTTSYPLKDPGSDFVHEMRMSVIPVEESVNRYFIVGLTSDYDEIILPMHAALVRLIASSAILILGVLLIVVLAVRLVLQNRRRDTELQQLIQRSEETQRLLEKTQELAHHQRLETIGTLTASIAHEFNNLLTPIMGYAILTLEGLPEDADDLADNVSEIYEASRKAKVIIARLNELSRRNPEDRFGTLSLKTLADKALHVAAPALPPHVTTVLEAGTEHGYVSGSEVQLSQLLLNLILNAYHAMEATGGQLMLRLSSEDEWAVLQVADEGSGIPEDALPHIFEPFYTTKESGRGTGLGLAIVQRVVESHHGQISVSSRVGQGTVITVRLPRAEAAETEAS